MMGMPRPEHMELEDWMLERRVVFLRGEIDHVSGSRVCVQMLYLQQIDAARPVTLVVDSPGGGVDDGLAVYDIVRHLAPLVRTHCDGRAEGMAAIVVAAGARGRRTAVPEARFRLMECNPDAAVETGEAAELRARGTAQTNEMLRKVVAKATGRPEALIAERMREGRSMRAAEAVALGLIDALVEEPWRASGG